MSASRPCPPTARSCWKLPRKRVWRVPGTWPCKCRRRERAGCWTSLPTRTTPGPTSWEPGPKSGGRPGARTPLCQLHGHHRHDHGLFHLSQAAESGDPDHRTAALGGFQHSRDSALARGLPAQYLRGAAGGPCDGYFPGRVGGDHAPPGRRGGYFLRRFLRGCHCRGPAIIT